MTTDDRGEEERLAPVTPLFGGPERSAVRHDEPVHAPSERHPARAGLARAEEQSTSKHQPPRLRALSDATVPDTSMATPVRRAAAETPAAFGRAVSDSGDEAQRREDAAAALVRKLRGKAMSVAEARLYLRALELSEAVSLDIVDEFVDRGYLNDGALAEQLIYAGVQRKGLGRSALRRALQQRGLDAHTIDDALIEVPDDDAERALEYARGKASSMVRLDREVAMRRLLGQLARRGYGGSIASAAARTALSEASRTSSSTGRVRFVDSDEAR